MALADRLNEIPDTIHGAPCSVGVLLDKFEGAELETFRAMLGDPDKRDGVSAAVIYQTVTAEGHHIGFQSIGKHRRRQCRCFRDAR